MSTIRDDARIDPRIRQVFGAFPAPLNPGDATSREQFYRLLLAAGVPAQCRQVMGTIHATEIFPIAAPEVSRETARSIADFCRGTTRRG